MHRLSILLITISLYSCKDKNEVKEYFSTVTEIPQHRTKLTKAEVRELDTLNIDFQFYSSCFAYSSAKNAEESNGEAHSDNLPKVVDSDFRKEGLYLVINQNEFVRIDSKFLGCKLYLINTTNRLKKLKAADSRLYIVAEALNQKYQWRAISNLPTSGCGNSYHTVKLGDDEYWEFDIPIFSGAIKTKLRYVLTIDENTKVYSNEITAYINSGQFDDENQQFY